MAEVSEAKGFALRGAHGIGGSSSISASAIPLEPVFCSRTIEHPPPLARDFRHPRAGRLNAPEGGYTPEEVPSSLGSRFSRGPDSRMKGR